MKLCKLKLYLIARIEKNKMVSFFLSLAELYTQLIVTV